ncbi:MAG TPA: histidine kinase [Nitrococcus sp.]|nr:histidine kinase [Nitrococcus sp.]
MAARETFLPNFCAIRSVFAIVVVGELLVLVMVLVRPLGAESWQELSLLSLFVQWIGLGSAALLCLLRDWFSRLGNAAAAALSYGLIVGVALLVSEGAYRLIYGPVVGAGHSQFLLRSVAVTAIAAAVALRYMHVQHEWRARIQAAAEARIDALQARIRPHFLFNSLNTIASLIPSAPAEAERLVEDLADLFRASLGRRDRLVALAEELELADGYLRMEGLRLGERLRLQWDIAGLPHDALIPPLSLQPLLENAVYHGIEPRLEGGTLSIHGAMEGGMVAITVCNPSPVPNARLHAGLGMAQENVRERLQLAFARHGRLQVQDDQGLYHVTVRFPYRRA